MPLYRESLRTVVGHVTGGRVFGYDNERKDGHVERKVNGAEAEVVREIFQRYADGEGFKHIAHALNARRLPAPPSAASSRRGLGPRRLQSGRPMFNSGNSVVSSAFDNPPPTPNLHDMTATKTLMCRLAVAVAAFELLAWTALAISKL